MAIVASLDTASVNGNWIPDINRHNLPKPPQWFLTRLWDLDAALVVLPARTGRKYLLARRRELSLRVPMLVENLKTAALKKHARVNYSDGDLLAQYKLVSVDTLVGNFHTGWSGADLIFQNLRERDMWADGGVDGFIKRMEEREAEIANKKRAKLLGDIEHRAGDAYRSYKARTGQRTKLSPSSRTDGTSGIVITG